MKIDAYTKFLLTVIALCLLYLCGRDAIMAPKVHADAPLEVILVDGRGHALAVENTYGMNPALPVMQVR
jgi:hypothetical protein